MRTIRTRGWLAGGVLSGLAVLMSWTLSGAAAAQEPAAPISVMTFNIRYGTANDGVNRWANRRDFLFDVVRSSQADVIGLQEALDGQLQEIITAVPEYGVIGVGRDDGKTKGEYAAILFRKDRFHVSNSGTFWFSDTPDIVASTSWGNTITRICTWARLVDRDGRAFWHFNVHLDHQSQPSRERSTQLLAERIRNRRVPDEPVIVTGDFNVGEDNAAIATLVGPRGGQPPLLVDTFRVVHPDEKVVGTFSGFTLNETSGPKIDYILVLPGTDVLDARIIRDSRDGRYPSDHFPVTARVRARQDPGRAVPVGLDGPVRPPADNPMRPDVIALGRRLFFDKALSRTGVVSCATCHDPERAFADARAKAVGVDGRIGSRNAPALINRGYGDSFFWDGRAATLEAQVTQPITNPVELDSSVERVVELARRDRTYADAFRRAFGRAPAGEDLARALASYVRSIQSGNSRVDRYLLGDSRALTAQEQRGLLVFRNRGLCTTCHAGANLTDEKFHNTGVSWDAAAGRFLDEGRAAVTKAVADRGAFRTPTLREIARTAPYMHDGSLATIEAVIDFYDQGGRDNPYLDSEMMKLSLSAADKAALAAFLRALTGTVVEGR